MLIKNISKLVVVMFAVVAFNNVVQAADVEAGKAKFAALCGSCHGVMGKGDGPVGLSLPPNAKPADLSGAVKYATDLAKFKDLLAKGGAAVGLSALMPPQAGLTDADIDNLWAFIQSLKK